MKFKFIAIRRWWLSRLIRECRTRREFNIINGRMHALEHEAKNG